MVKLYLVISETEARTFDTFDKAYAYVQSKPFSERGKYEIKSVESVS